jgi:hypothetical protein
MLEFSLELLLHMRRKKCWNCIPVLFLSRISRKSLKTLKLHNICFTHAQKKHWNFILFVSRMRRTTTAHAQKKSAETSYYLFHACTALLLRMRRKKMLELHTIYFAHARASAHVQKKNAGTSYYLFHACAELLLRMHRKKHWNCILFVSRMHGKALEVLLELHPTCSTHTQQGTGTAFEHAQKKCWKFILLVSRMRRTASAHAQKKALELYTICFTHAQKGTGTAILVATSICGTWDIRLSKLLLGKKHNFAPVFCHLTFCIALTLILTAS